MLFMNLRHFSKALFRSLDVSVIIGMCYCYERISFVRTHRVRVRSFPCCRLFIRSKIHSVSSVHVFLRYAFETFFFFFPSLRLIFTEASTVASVPRMQLLCIQVSFQTPRSFLRKLRFQIFITEIMRRACYTSSAQLVHPRDETSAESGNPLARTFNIRGYLFYARVTLDPILLANDFASSSTSSFSSEHLFISPLHISDVLL